MTDETTQSCFLDSNIWIYALAQQDSEKRDVAAKLIQSAGIVVSTQVINEVCVNLIKKASFSEVQVKALIADFHRGSQVVTFTADSLIQASALRESYALSFWDSLIVSSALQTQVPILYSEDMQHQLVINQQLQIINPFLQ